MFVIWLSTKMFYTNIGLDIYIVPREHGSSLRYYRDAKNLKANSSHKSRWWNADWCYLINDAGPNNGSLCSIIVCNTSAMQCYLAVFIFVWNNRYVQVYSGALETVMHECSSSPKTEIWKYFSSSSVFYIFGLEIFYITYSSNWSEWWSANFRKRLRLIELLSMGDR